MKQYRCPNCGSDNVWLNAVKNANTGEIAEQDTMTCYACWYERAYGFTEIDVPGQPPKREIVLMAAYHGLLSDAVVLEKSRLFVASQSGHGQFGGQVGWTEVQQLAWRVVQIGYKAGFREAEAAYRLGSAVSADPEQPGLWEVIS